MAGWKADLTGLLLHLGTIPELVCFRDNYVFPLGAKERFLNDPKWLQPDHEQEKSD